MSSIIGWIVALTIAAALFAVAVIFFKAYRSGTSPSEVLFKPKPVPRLGVVEFASMDGKRKLVLIRRDDVEHLIMTGGPVDVVIESGIGQASQHQPAAAAAATSANLVETARRAVEAQHVQHAQQFQAPPAAPVFSRPPRAFTPVSSTAAPSAASPASVPQSVAEAAEAAADLALKR